MIQSRSGETCATTDFSATEPEQRSKDRLRQHTDDTKRQAENLKQKAGETAHQASERLKESGRQARDQAMNAARETSSRIRSQASSRIREGKDRVVEEVHVFGEALHCAADTLDKNNDEKAGRYIHQAADWVDSFADSLQRQDPDQMMRAASNFTRRHPEIVLGGLFMAGIAAARFLKASNRHEPEFDDFESEYDDSPSGFHATGGMATGMDDETAYGDIELYAGESDLTAKPVEPVADIPAPTSPSPTGTTLGSTSPSSIPKAGPGCDSTKPR